MKVKTIRAALAALALVPFVAGCSGGGGSDGPTAPPMVGGSGTAMIGGSISTGGGSGSAASPAAAHSAGAAPFRAALRADGVGHAAPPPAGGGRQAVTGRDETGAGVLVSIQGTGISATADAQGRFRLDGVPGGNRLLVFDHGGGTASLLVEAIRQRESIDLDVTVSGSNVQVNSMTRDGGEERTLDPAALSLSLDPGEWNLNYDRSQGTVEAFLRGEGFDLVDLDTIEMEGDGDGGPLAAESASRQGDHVHARFAKNRVLDLLADPAPGSMHTVVVTFMEAGGDERFELEAQVTIANDDEEDDGEDDGEDGEDDEGEDDEGDDAVVELTLDMQPDSWNTNWLRSNGTVSALIRGSGFDRVDLDSIVLVGSDPAAGELAPERADAQGNHVRAFFAQSDAFLTLLDGDTGQTHVITIRFTVEGEEMELTDTIRTVGPAL